MTGTVKWFDNHKGFGFITTDAGDDVFVHYTGIASDGFRKLSQNQQVTFSLEKDDTGRTIARNVEKVS